MTHLIAITISDRLGAEARDAFKEGFMRAILRGLAVLPAAAMLSIPALSCQSSAGPAPASGPTEVKYKCACGKERMAAAGAAAPS